MRLFVSLFLALSLQASEVRVLAAASLTEALTEIARDYEAHGGETVVFSFGASSLLARQIEAGAPADLFLSADERTVDALARRNRIEPATRVRLLSNSLVIVVPRSGGKRIQGPRDLTIVESLALAEPSTVPAGVYARQWLECMKVWDQVRSRVIPTDNVRGALAAVAAGNADAAIVYSTDARISKDVRVAYSVPRAETPGISYPFVVLREAENPSGARRFLAWLRGPRARSIFIRYGFDVRR